MSLYETIRLIEAIADEGREAYEKEYINGDVNEALRKIDDFLIDIGEG